VSFASVTLCIASQRVYCRLFRYGLSPETFGYTLVSSNWRIIVDNWRRVQEKVVVAYLKFLSQHMSRVSEESHETHPRYEAILSATTR
jgi:hypothetical protein